MLFYNKLEISVIESNLIVCGTAPGHLVLFNMIMWLQYLIGSNNNLLEVAVVGNARTSHSHSLKVFIGDLVNRTFYLVYHSGSLPSLTSY